MIGGERYHVVLVPSAPVPVGGCLVSVPAAWVKPANIGVETLMSIYVSMGVASPLIATLSYSFARINAALKMKVEDLRPRGAGWTIRLHEKGGKQHAMPCHHALAEALRAYIDAAGIVEDRKGWLFRTARARWQRAL